MERVTVVEVDSTSYRGLELAFLVPAIFCVLFGVAVVVTGLLEPGGAHASFSAVFQPVSTFGLFFVGAAVTFQLLSAVFLYQDATEIAAQNFDWQPTPWLFALLGLCFGWFVVAYYLYRRHEYVVDLDSGEWWWLVVVGAVVIALLTGVALFLVFGILGGGYGLVFSIAMAITFGAMGAIPVALYFDSLHVRLNSGWQPNPVWEFALGIVAVSLPILPFIYGTYYLSRRYANYGFSR